MQLVQKVAEAKDENEVLSQALQELQASSCHPLPTSTLACIARHRWT